MGRKRKQRSIAQRFWSEERREVGPNERQRPNVLHVYGVDVLKTKDIVAYFHLNETPFEIEWINDSCCNIVLESAKAVDQTISAVTAEAGAPSAEKSGKEEGWHEGKAIRRKGVTVQLMFRLATLLDTKDNMKTQKSRFLSTANAQKVHDLVVGDEVMEEPESKGKTRQKKKTVKSGRNQKTPKSNQMKLKQPSSVDNHLQSQPPSDQISGENDHEGDFPPNSQAEEKT